MRGYNQPSPLASSKKTNRGVPMSRATLRAPAWLERPLRTLLVPMLLTALVYPIVASGQAYPDKPVRVVIPWPPGGSNDIVGRIIAQHVSVALGQPFVIDN